MKPLFYFLILFFSVFDLPAQVNYGPNKIFYQVAVSPGLAQSNVYNKVFRGDADGDGIEDVIIAGASKLNVILFDAAGNTRTTAVSAGSYPVESRGAAVAADFNKDGKLDFAWYNATANDIIISYWTSNNASNIPQYSTPARLNLTGLANASGTGTYLGVYGMSVADIDGDNDIDIIAMGPNGTQRPHMVINNGNNTFTRYDLHSSAVYQSVSQIADMNGDGKLDVLASTSGGIWLYTNTGNSGSPAKPVFTQSVLITPADAETFDSNGGHFDVVDFNKDGKPDILLNYNKSTFYKTRFYINRTTAAPTYVFKMTEFIPAAANVKQIIGGFGAQYQDVDASGTLDIIGTRGGTANNDFHKTTVNRVSIDGTGTVTLTESTLVGYTPLELNTTMGVTMQNKDIDGDGQTDYVYSRATHDQFVVRKTVFPQYKRTDLTGLQLGSTTAIGGSSSDNITLTIKTATGSNGTIAVTGSGGGTVTGSGTSTVTVSGTVSQVNNSLANFTFTPASYLVHTLELSVVNAASQTYTNTITVDCSPVKYYPKAAGIQALNDLQNWSTAIDGTGTAPANFGSGKEFVLSNSAGNTSFALNGNWDITGKLTLPAGASLDLGNYLTYFRGDLSNAGSIVSEGNVGFYGATAQKINGTNSFKNLVINNSAGVTVENDITVEGYLQLSGGELNIGNYTLAIKGIVTPAGGLINAANGIVEFNGTSSQSLSPSWFSTTVGQLKINNPTGVCITSNIAVAQLALASGKLILDNYDLTVSAITGGSASAFVSTNSTGILKATIANNQVFPFAVGNSSYNPVTITNRTESADQFTIKVLDEVYANGVSGTALISPRVKRTWDIGKASPNGGSGIDFAFTWNSPEQVQIVSPAFYHFEGGKWVKQSGTTSASGTTLTYTGYTGSFSPFAVGDATSLLPLTWLSFTAQKQEHGVALEWITAAEQNTRDFIVEHSTDGVQWQSIGTVPASGDRQSTYRFVHTRPAPGQNWYRIQQRDLDQRSTFSKIIGITSNDTESGFQIYPNPVKNGILNITLKKEGVATIANHLGVIVLKKAMAIGYHQLDIHNLPKGTYFITVDGKTEQFVIQ